MSKMLLFLTLVAAAVAQQTTTIDPLLLQGIFGTPSTASVPTVVTPQITVTSRPTHSSVTTEKRQNVIVKPTDRPTIVDKNGVRCQCVPYYLCDSQNNGININNASVTGWGELDVRFGDEYDRVCQESVELCCTAPKSPSEVPKPKPDSSRLRGCGYSNPNGLNFTIRGNGDESQFGEFPWVVMLLDTNNDSYVGVGVLIHPQVVMTGAHIAAKYGPGKLKARAGEWDTQTVQEILDFQDRVVQEIYVHADFKPKSLANDVALLRLQSPFQLADHINMLCLPDQDESFDNSKRCVSNGWGKDVFGLQGRYAVILKKLESDIVPHGRCNSLLQQTRLGSHFKLHSSFICAGGEEGKDLCQGDGGAPLACPIGNDRYKLAGLVAWGIGCGQKDVPSVYASVPAFRRWVDGKMSEWGYGTSTYTI